MTKININQTKYYNFITIFFVFCLLISNLAEIKIIDVFGWGQFGAGTIFFPLLYVLNDIVTEVYGYTASRRTIWLALFFNLLFSMIMYLVMFLPSGPDWQEKEAFETVFALSPRIIIGSITSFYVGELINAIIIANLKLQLKGKIFAVRALFSTLISSLIESILFSIIAFYGRLPGNELVKMICMLTLAKVLYEFFIMPLSIKLTTFLKKAENLDVYEKPTLRATFAPFW